jgi:hypothetical protein
MAMLKRVLLILALGASLWVIGTVVRVAYYIHTHSGPLNSSGGQLPTSCSVQTVKQDCQALKCISGVWYCDEHGTPMCMDGKCVCYYGCL